MANKPLITKQEQMLIHNSITGNVESANVKVSVHIQKESGKFLGMPYTMLFQKFGVVTAKTIKPITAKLLLYLLACVEYGNIVTKGPTQMAEELNYSKRNVLRALSELEELKIIIRDKNTIDKRMSLIYINPLNSWKGKVSDRAKKIAEYDANQLELFPELSKKQVKAIQPNTDF